jgi:hypothetical protein
MDLEEVNGLFIQINGPWLSASRYIYAIQFRNNLLQFGTARNKYGAKKVEITKSDNGYNIKFIYYKADYKNFGPMTKQIKYEENNISAEQIKELLNQAFS